jgi:hypothetical protein
LSIQGAVTVGVIGAVIVIIVVAVVVVVRQRRCGLRTAAVAVPSARRDRPVAVQGHGSDTSVAVGTVFVTLASEASSESLTRHGLDVSNAIAEQPAASAPAHATFGESLGLLRACTSEMAALAALQQLLILASTAPNE